MLLSNLGVIKSLTSANKTRSQDIEINKMIVAQFIDLFCKLALLCSEVDFPILNHGKCHMNLPQK